ncbi:MAG: glycoside hydrolase family 127 protein [Planctomycetaceae bacterium]|nr:glycoside hydrolase family 127 protein [Planctomycetaceae bacterium]
MRLTIWLTVIPLIGLAFGAWPSQLKGNVQTDTRRSALQPVSFRPLALGQVKPSGWLREQLETQAAGLSGHLDEFWPDMKNSAWIGGNAESWERVPYWLDGIVPLAYLLDDQALQARIKPFIDSIIEHQHPDGWLGPVGDTAGHKPYDPWPLFPLFKALTQYQEATGDPRVVPALLRCARKIDQVVDQTPLYSWAKTRVADFAVSLYWLYDRTGEAWLLDLARKAFAQGHDWRAQFDDFKFTGKTQNRFDLDTHGVNTGMALKYGGIRYLHTGDARDKNAIFPMLDLLDKHHGQATGIFTCDEHLAGCSPSQGTELCTVVEAIYSLEALSAVTVDARLGDRLEKLAFNALPATFKKDMTAHQYDQQCNQVICSNECEYDYVNNGLDSNLYGLEPNFGCCTANLHQGWPKLTSSLWMRSADGGLAAIAYAPCIVETQIQGKPVRVEVTTDYPFRDTIEIAVTVPQARSFSLHLRVPAWTKDPTIRADSVKTVIGEPGRYFYIQGTWSGTKTISLRLPMSVRLYHGFNDSVAIERGPLVYALKIGAEWRKVKDNPQFADWEVFPTTPWNYALEIDREHPERSMTCDQRPTGTSPFTSEAAPVIARVKGRRLADWKIAKGAAAPPPSSPVKSAAPLEKLILIPYGCTDLRITEFPTLAPH